MYSKAIAYYDRTDAVFILRVLYPSGELRTTETNVLEDVQKIINQAGAALVTPATFARAVLARTEFGPT